MLRELGGHLKGKWACAQHHVSKQSPCFGCRWCRFIYQEPEQMGPTLLT